ncbi:hypothetical protein QOZ80_1AG0008470 [Eleusine coracana subsp. coracana]|nr:hypothetical protein QOZ80_1AG0008470 [Eleusine coracana subsp. coracana]
MEQEKRATVPAGVNASDEDRRRGDTSPEKGDASAADGSGNGDAKAESDEEEDLEEGLAEGNAASRNAGRGDASESAMNEDLDVPKNPFTARFRFRAAIAHPPPPTTTFRRLPVRSRKQYRPTRFFSAAGAAPASTRSAGVSAMSSTADQGSAVTCSAELSSASDDRKSGAHATNAAACTLCRMPSHGRKQRRPDHFIPEEAEASARAKARRSNAVLDRFLTAMLRVAPERRPEWVRNLAADEVDDEGGGEGQPEEGGPEEPEPDGRARVLTVLAVLGASMSLSVVACVLFYIIAQRTAHDRHKVSGSPSEPFFFSNGSPSEPDVERLDIWPAAEHRF